jgi:hypothetical protein
LDVDAAGLHLALLDCSEAFEAAHTLCNRLHLTSGESFSLTAAWSREGFRSGLLASRYFPSAARCRQPGSETEKGNIICPTSGDDKALYEAAILDILQKTSAVVFRGLDHNS